MLKLTIEQSQNGKAQKGLAQEAEVDGDGEVDEEDDEVYDREGDGLS